MSLEQQAKQKPKLIFGNIFVPFFGKRMILEMAEHLITKVAYLA